MNRIPKTAYFLGLIGTAPFVYGAILALGFPPLALL